ncbi:MAG TPA: T9SS type A sorting domain-containing protein [Flavobacterium sp.]|jgi:hypothetical protein|nr:T9SS type A sorting domain-containing protein [Flavobacterium sp.]
MQKTTILLLLLTATMSAQQKTTGEVDFLTLLWGQVVLDNSTSTATLTLNGPADRWFALTFGSFGKPGAMSPGNDVVYYNGTTLVDATHNGQGIAPTPDAVNNWTVVSNTVSSSIRTLIATRNFAGDATDYTFNFANTNIDLAAAHADSPIMTQLQYHGTNRENVQNVPFTSLGVEDFSLRSSQVFPNPSTGDFVIKSKSPLATVSVYTNTGAFVKTIEADQGSDQTEINVSGLAAGIYLIELKNDSERTWKKVIVN